jgi:IMP dehydrogenase
MDERLRREGLTFDDVLLLPAQSSVLPTQVSTVTLFSRNISINTPIVSAAMDTVTDSRLAVAIAREGGLGILHRNLTPDQQAAQVDLVKRSESGMIRDPITLSPERPISDALALMAKYRISGIPITRNERLVGILTNRDLRFVERTDILIEEVMTKDRIVTAPEGTTLEEAKAILHKNRIEKLPIVDRDHRLRGLITVKDIKKTTEHPLAAKDSHGRLRVGAAVGTGRDLEERVEKLLRAEVDAIVVDTAHGHTENVRNAVKLARRMAKSTDVVAGNVGTKEGAEFLIEAGVDAVKVGIGPGASCTTRIVAGIGVPQLTAIMECGAVTKSAGVPLIADGGVKYSGDVVKALAAGAQSVMIGSLFAGTEESPGELVLLDGRSYKVYRGMGSIGAMGEGSRDRYAQEGVEASKLVPEGIEGRVPYRGRIADTIFQLVGGLRAGMGYLGASNLEEMVAKARFVRITHAGLMESHPHDVIITKEAPNYGRRGS